MSGTNFCFFELATERPAAGCGRGERPGGAASEEEELGAFSVGHFRRTALGPRRDDRDGGSSLGISESRRRPSGCL